ncbi:hypothetical protein MUK42_09180 [Musa troglodytarum]|uniref:Major facilitator superfamily (MFS) profile domain-containing protein n=1 Tax=Musa troglodytarum TaxID=320322 RepID=A0A9E7JDX7_9LILI|nr:hypothetical protein MUK42_09180 [Musa troglodytarum]
MLGIAAVPSVMLAVGILAMPESPRWLVMQGRLRDAREVLLRATGDKGGRGVDESSPDDVVEPVATHRGEGVWKELLLRPTPAVRRILIASLGIHFFEHATGIEAVVLYTPRIFKKAGISSRSKLLFVTMGMGVTKTAFILVATLLLDKVGRRPLLLTSVAGMILSLSSLGFGLTMADHSQQKLPWALGLCIVSLLLFVAFFSIGLAPRYFPEVEGTGSQHGVAVNRVMNGTVSMTFISLYNAITIGGAFFLFAGIAILAWIFFFFFCPETKGVPLERIEEVFSKGCNGSSVAEDDGVAMANVASPDAGFGSECAREADVGSGEADRPLGQGWLLHLVASSLHAPRFLHRSGRMLRPTPPTHKSVTDGSESRSQCCTFPRWKVGYAMQRWSSGAPCARSSSAPPCGVGESGCRYAPWRKLAAAMQRGGRWLLHAAKLAAAMQRGGRWLLHAAKVAAPCSVEEGGCSMQRGGRWLLHAAKFPRENCGVFESTHLSEYTRSSAVLPDDVIAPPALHNTRDLTAQLDHGTDLRGQARTPPADRRKQVLRPTYLSRTVDSNTPQFSLGNSGRRATSDPPCCRSAQQPSGAVGKARAGAIDGPEPYRDDPRLPDPAPWAPGHGKKLNTCSTLNDIWTKGRCRLAPRRRDDPAATIDRYWNIFSDAGLYPPSRVPPSPPTVTVEAFQDLSQQVRTLASSVQAVLSRLLQEATPPVPSSPASRRVQDGTRALENLDVPPELEAVSSDSTDLFRSISRSIARPEEVQRDIRKSKEEQREMPHWESPFSSDIREYPVPLNFRLPSIDLYDGVSDPADHVAAFRAQMALYGTSDALMCGVPSPRLKGSASPRTSSYTFWRLRPKPSQKEDEPLSHFVRRFTTEVREFIHDGAAEILRSLVERPPASIAEMFQRASQYVAAESWMGHPTPSRSGPITKRGAPHQGHRMGRPDPYAAEPPPPPLKASRTQIFLQIKERGMLRPPPQMKGRRQLADSTRYCRFHRQNGHDTEQCYESDKLKSRSEEVTSINTSKDPRHHPRADGPAEQHIDAVGSKGLRPSHCDREYRLLRAEITFSGIWEQQSMTMLGVRTDYGRHRSSADILYLSWRKPQALHSAPPAIGRLDLAAGQDLVTFLVADSTLNSAKGRSIHIPPDAEVRETSESARCYLTATSWVRGKGRTASKTHADAIPTEHPEPTNPPHRLLQKAQMFDRYRDLPNRPRPRLGPLERQQAMNEVDVLLAPDFIEEKPNGSWRMCVDYTDLNRACPKDCFPLPRIDQLVDSTAGYARFSFMDAYSGYNQIRMAPEDRQHTAFHTPQGAYFYKVMPFGLKNAGATYQRMVNKVFARQIGRNMEVYSQWAAHLDDLRKPSTAEKTRMRLNPPSASSRDIGKFLGIAARPAFYPWPEIRPKELTAQNARKPRRRGKDLSELPRLTSYAVSSVLVKEAPMRNTRFTTRPRVCVARSALILPLKATPYFQAHTIEVSTDQPRFDRYKPRMPIKACALADFISELTPTEAETVKQTHRDWVLHVDGSSSSRGAGTGLILEDPDGHAFERSLRFGFTATNNEAEYKALLAGLRLAAEMQLGAIHILTDSQLVAEQVGGEYRARDSTMSRYLTEVRAQTSNFPRPRTSAHSAREIGLGADPQEHPEVEESTHRPVVAMEIGDPESRPPHPRGFVEVLKSRHGSPNPGVVLRNWQPALQKVIPLRRKRFSPRSTVGFVGSTWAAELWPSKYCASGIAYAAPRRRGFRGAPQLLASRRSMDCAALRQWGMDLLGPHIIVGIDIYQVVWKNIVTRFGSPNVIIIDNGTRHKYRFSEFSRDLPHPLEVTNRSILDGLRKRTRGPTSRVDELPSILWSRDHPKTAGEVPIQPAFGVEAVPATVRIHLAQGVRAGLDSLEERRPTRIAARSYNKRVRRLLNGRLTTPPLKGQACTQVGRPYRVIKVVRPNAPAATMIGQPSRTWNVQNLKKYFV